jgi:HlyD family secretion protein
MMKAKDTARSQSVASRMHGRRPRRWRKFIPYAVAAGLVIAIVAAMLPKPIRVETASVTRGSLIVSVFEEGKTRIRHRYMISPPVAGFLNRIELRPGAPIQMGKTILATLEAQLSGFLDARGIAETEARVKAAEAAKMQRAAELDRAKSALELASKELARADALRKTGAIATQEWDAAENRLQVLTRELHAAEFALHVADFEIAQAKAALMQAQHPASDKSEPLRIVAPVDGYVLNVYEESARVVTTNMPIMEVGDPQDLEAEIELLSSDAVGVAAGADVSIEHWGGESPLRGRVSVVEPGAFTKISALGVEEQRVKVRVDFLDSTPPGRSLGDRYRVEARIVTWHGDDVLQVPTGALFRRGNEWMTFAIKEGKARLRKVEIAHNNGVDAEVRSGLLEGDAVIVHPPDTVHDGASVMSDSHRSP